MPYLTHTNKSLSHFQSWDARLTASAFLVHGNLASNRWWLPMISHWPSLLRAESNSQTLELASAVNKFYAFEWRGCGASSAPIEETELSPWQMAKDLLDVIEATTSKSEAVDLVGHSTGGVICLSAALLAPQKIRKIVLIDSVGPKGIVFEESFNEFFNKMKNDRSLCQDVLLSTVHGVSTKTPFFDKVVDDAMGVAPLNWTGVLSQLAKFDISSKISQLSQETLILHGEFDNTCPFADAQLYAQILPHARLRVLKERGHCPIVEAPDLIANILFEFLSN